MLRRDQICNEICKIANIKRYNYKKETLSKRELYQLLSYLEIQKNSIRDLKIQIQALNIKLGK